MIRNFLSVANPFSFLVYGFDIIIVASFALFFAEILPRLLCRLYANALLKYLSPIIGLFYIVLSPFVFIFVQSLEFIIAKCAHIPLQKRALRFTPLDIDQFINEFCLQQEENENYTSEILMVQNVIELKKTKVSDCMLPQDQIVLANLHSSVDTLKQKFIDSGFSKIPIYDTDPNKVIGYVHAYDLFKKPKEIAKLIRPIYAVSSTMPINTALTDMIAKHISISVVFDETQKLLGLLTLEDLMEEIFGEIEDEFDR